MHGASVAVYSVFGGIVTVPIMRAGLLGVRCGCELVSILKLGSCAAGIHWGRMTMDSPVRGNDENLLIPGLYGRESALPGSRLPSEGVI
jgi:hypothetical protein